MARLLSPEDVAAYTGAHTPTAEQAEVIGAPLAPSAIVAGAGSGKTETMAARVVWLVCNGLVDPDRVLGLTFTRKAAGELGERVRDRLREAASAIPGLDPALAAAMRSAEPTVLTYDSYARRIVAEHGLRLGIEASVQTADAAALWQLAGQVVSGYDGPLEQIGNEYDYLVNAVVALSDEMAAHLVDVADLVRVSEKFLAHRDRIEQADSKELKGDAAKVFAGTTNRLILAPVLAQFAERKAELDLMSFGDMLQAACTLTATQPGIGEIERARYDVVMLDEYQDTSSAQASLLQNLFTGHPITAVGDPCQAIYGFRGASADTLPAFRMSFGAGKAVPLHRLRTTFRNDHAILALANDVAGPLRAAGADVAELSPGPAAGPGELNAGLFETTAQEAAAIAADIAERWRPGESTVAVLSRARSEEFGAVVDALLERGLPTEVVGLSGLLSTPEVREVVQTLAVLTRPTADAELVQLLGGRRWKIGPADLVSLSTYAKRLAGRADADADEDEVDEASLVDALDRIGDSDPKRFSADGWQRLNDYAAELGELRELMGEPLADLIGAIERAIGVDLETTVRDLRRGVPPRAALDQFTSIAHSFSGGSGTDSAEGFLQYLEAAEKADRGITRVGAAPRRDAVQVLTMHASKGLEWDAVYIVGATSNVLPGKPKPSIGWVGDLGTLPYELRGDRAVLPQNTIKEAQSAKDVRNVFLADFKEQVKDRHAEEQRRLVYVAVTRARRRLWMSAALWKPGVKKCRPPSEYLELVRKHAEISGGRTVAWVDLPDSEAQNPADAEVSHTLWPDSELTVDQRIARAAAARLQSGSHRDDDAEGPDVLADGAERPDVLSDGAERPDVLSDSAEGLEVLPDVLDAVAQPLPDPQRGHVLPAGSDGIDAQHPWLEATDLLIAERAARRASTVIDIEAPVRLSASELVAIRKNPVEFAMDVRRPVPRLLRAAADRGTLFHSWVEHRFGSESLLDIDDLPGAGDEELDADTSIEDLITRFEASEWAHRRPLETETGFDLVVDGIPLRGRLDAVFEWPGDDADYDVIDWKTGRIPTGDDLAAAEVQLAVYRLAWARIAGVSPDRVRAGFFYVADGITHRPKRILAEADLIDLVRTLPASSTT